jgi:hypothetical protein
VTFPAWRWGNWPVEEDYWCANLIETFTMAYAYCAIGEYDPPYYDGTATSRRSSSTAKPAR